MLVAIFLYFIIGILTGIGGHILAVGSGLLMTPVLTWIGYSPGHAVSTSLLASSISSIYYIHRKWRNNPEFSWKIILAVGIPAFIATIVATSVYYFIPPLILVFLYSAVMFICLDLISSKDAPLCNKISIEDRLKHFYIQYTFIGIVAGFLAGLLGSNGAIIIFSMLVCYTYYNTKDAIRTATVVVAFTSVAGFVGHSSFGNFPSMWGIVLGIGAVVGTQTGSIAIEHIQDSTIRGWVRVFLLSFGIITMFQALVVP
ncbi:MAG: sulfite exporter TauE/SafE family protein [Oligoflexia bacterium]|nr:sulfite exporter TauE/SafE family protein [Oligoflexia bacterium]